MGTGHKHLLALAAAAFPWSASALGQTALPTITVGPARGHSATKHVAAPRAPAQTRQVAARAAQRPSRPPFPPRHRQPRRRLPGAIAPQNRRECLCRGPRRDRGAAARRSDAARKDLAANAGRVADSAASGNLHIRNEHANVQYRINGILLPDGVSGFSQIVETGFAGSISLVTGALPAQYGLRTSALVDSSRANCPRRPAAASPSTAAAMARARPPSTMVQRSANGRSSRRAGSP